MIRGIDHLVIAVGDLDAAAESYRALGFAVVPGGRHPVGTHNALIAFADESYVELLAFYEESPEHRWWEPLQRGEGLVDFCLRTDDLTADTAAFRAAGVTITEPRAQSRVRPDGYRVAWVFSLPTGAHRGVAPFLIRDETPRDERVPRERTQPNGVIGIGTVTVAVADVAPVRAWYARALGVPGEDVRREGIHGAGVRFTVGPHALEFLAPAGDQGPLAEHLARRGPSPFGATLRTAAGRAGTLDPARARGARLTLVAA